MMAARRLLSWVRLEEQRRRRARRGLLSLSPWLSCGLAGLALALLVGGLLGIGQAGSVAAAAAQRASRLWIGALIAAQATVLFTAPFRMYWRRDSALLARLSISGTALYLVPLVGSLRAALQVGLAFLIALVPLASAVSPQLALRHLVLVAFAAITAGGVGPAVSLLAGSLVASHRARAALESLAGEFSPPKTAWLGILPGMAAGTMALMVIAAANWALGIRAATALGDPLLLFTTSGAIAVAATGAALAAADRFMVTAASEVATLDQQRLAHVERSRVTRLERLWGRWLLGTGLARVVYEKDCRLMRRRFPLPYFFRAAGLFALWLVAALAESSPVAWAAALASGLGAYTVVMARRSVSPPVEIRRLLCTLPVDPAQAMAAKRGSSFFSALLCFGAGCLPVIGRAADPRWALITLGGLALASIVASMAAIRLFGEDV